VSERTAKRRRKSSSKPKKPVAISTLRKNTFVADKDVHPNALTTKILGSLNPVTRTDLSDATKIKGGPTIYFKPGYEAKYAVASTRLARALGMETVISHNAFAHMNDEDGAVSGQVLGVPVRSVGHNKVTQIPEDFVLNPNDGPTPQDFKRWLVSVGAAVIQKPDGQYYEVSDYVQNPINYKDPRIQKGMSDLQIFDAISGQIDRHGGNIYIDPATGKVTGIDDDASMKDLPWGVDRPYQKYPGLAPLVDRTTVQKVLALQPEDVPALLARQRNDLGELSEAQIQAAEKRLRDVQAYLGTLEGTPAIVDTWDDGTFATLMAQPDKSYLGRAERDYQLALAHTPIDGLATSVGPPLVAPPPLPWAAVRPTAGGAQPSPSNVPTSPRRPAIAQTRPRLRDQQLGDQQRRDQQPDNRQLVDQQRLDEFDAFPPLPTTPQLPVSTSSSSARAAVSRLAARTRGVGVAMERNQQESPRPPDVDLSESSSEPQDTVTTIENDTIENDTIENDTIENDTIQGATPPESPLRSTRLEDIERELKVINALLRDLTGQTGDV
jgi:hypothetical protein